MPPYPGEERLLTLFADVHYYLSQPAIRPSRHRFDKASYFYIYYNSTRHTSRVEIANNPGTSEQDAIYGYLDKCRVVNASKFPTLVTFILDAENASASPTSGTAKDPDEWRLSSGDQQDTHRGKHRVHTVDIYFWVQDDARLVVDFCKKLLAPAQLDVGEIPSATPVPKQDAMSPVVQNLESVAISDPAYQNGQTRNSQNQSQAVPVKLPPPPPMPSHVHQSSPSVTSGGASALSQSSTRRSPAPTASTVTDFTPMAYNPAAPAAPEPIAHREKTPPPEDGDEGTGLSHAAVHDGGYRPHQTAPHQYSSMSSSQTSHSQWGSPPPPPPMGLNANRAYGSPPPPSSTPGYSQTSSLSYASTSPQHQHSSKPTSTSTALSYGLPPGSATANHDLHRHSVAAENYTPDPSQYQQHPVETPGTQFYNTLPHERKPLQHIQPKYPTEYFVPTGSPAYPLPPQQNNAGGGSGNSYDVHQQVYIPESHEQKHSKPSRSERKPSSSKTESSSGMFRGLGKKLNSTANKMIDKVENQRFA